MKFLVLIAMIQVCAVVAFAQQQPPPREWIDPDTGHRVIRLSEEPGSASLYFHQNPYTPDGQKLIITTPSGLSAINLSTHAIEKIVDGRVGVLIVGRKTGDVYYTRTATNNNVRTTTVYATNLNTKATREIVKLPPAASVASVNADETLLAGTIDEKLLADLADAWEASGKNILERLAITEPGKLAQIAYGLLPRDVFISVEQRTPGNLEPDEWALLVHLVQLIKSSAPAGAAATKTRASINAIGSTRKRDVNSWRRSAASSASSFSNFC